jgi:hypothetical protein
MEPRAQASLGCVGIDSHRDGLVRERLSVRPPGMPLSCVTKENPEALPEPRGFSTLSHSRARVRTNSLRELVVAKLNQASLGNQPYPLRAYMHPTLVSE